MDERYVISINTLKAAAMDELLEEFEVHANDDIFLQRTKAILALLDDTIDVIQEHGQRLAVNRDCEVV